MFSPCSTQFNSKQALQADLHGQKDIFSLFGPLFGPLGTIFGALWVWQMGKTGQPECPKCCSNPVPTRSTTIYGNKAYLNYFVIFGPTFAYFLQFLNQRANFAPFFHMKKDLKWFDWTPLLCSNLVPPRPSQNRPSRLICVAKRLFSAYWGHSGSGKWAKLLSLNLLSAVPTLFQPVSQKIRVLRPI